MSANVLVELNKTVPFHEETLDALIETLTEKTVDVQGDLPERLYHYSSTAGLKGILETRKLWATHSRFVNDASEIDYGMFVLAATIDQLKAKHQNKLTGDLLEVLSKSGNAFDKHWNLYISCFCEKDDVLHQWRDYAGHGGYALGFATEKVFANPQKSYYLRKVIYDPDVQGQLMTVVLENVIEAMHKLCSSSDAGPTKVVLDCARFARTYLSMYLATFKHPAFQSEHEWRLCHLRATGNDEKSEKILFRDGEFGLTPYVELDISTAKDDKLTVLPLETVTHAPSANAPNIRLALQLLLRSVGLPEVTIAGSSLPIRTC
jgi:hypothetical protein